MARNNTKRRHGSKISPFLFTYALVALIVSRTAAAAFKYTIVLCNHRAKMLHKKIVSKMRMDVMCFDGKKAASFVEPGWWTDISCRGDVFVSHHTSR